MQRLRRRLRVFATALGPFLGAALAPLATDALAADPASVMIVVDGTGSMRGLVDPKTRPGKAKLAAVQDALRPALAKVSPQTRIGLAIFGHRRGSCVDTEIARAPQPVDADAIMAPLMQIRPTFKGPLTFSLREAAKQLPKDGAPRSLVVIHDGSDDCRQDPCAAADELAAAGITAHVVSLGMDASDLAKMACLWQATGGRHFNAETVEQVEAGIAEALLAASRAPAAVGTASGSWATTVVPPAPVPARGPTALHLRALWGPNAEAVGVPLYWTVARKDAPEATLFESSARNPVVPVAPGDYVVTLRSDLITASEAVSVGDNRPKAVPIVLGAGALRVRAVAQRTGTPLADALITVAAVDGTPLAVFRAAEAATLLPPGRYRISAEVGLVGAEQTVTVTEGRSAQVDLALSMGRLLLTAAARDAGAASDAAPLFIVMEDDPPRGRREVARSAASRAEFVLPPGTYYVMVRQGGAEARERVELNSGEVVRHTLGGAVGQLALSSSSPVPLAGNLVSYTVKRLDDPDQETIWTGRSAPLLSLPAGRYRVEGRYGLTNLATTRDVEIEAGQTQQLSIEHQAATLRVRLTGIGAGLADVTWEVRDERERVVWAGSQTEGTAVLQAGRYRVSAYTASKQLDQAVELRAGEARVVEMRAE
jgi:Ca-activated chloride channel family protein